MEETKVQVRQAECVTLDKQYVQELLKTDTIRTLGCETCKFFRDSGYCWMYQFSLEELVHGVMLRTRKLKNSIISTEHTKCPSWSEK